MNQNRDNFSSVRVGAYGICPTNEHIRGRTNQKMTGFVVYLSIYDEERANRYVRPLFFDRTMEAYAIRPYPDERKGGIFLFAVGRGRGGLAGVGFSNSLRLGKLEVFFLCLFLLFLS